MDNPQLGSTANASGTGYQGYGEESQHNSTAVRALEKEFSLDEYNLDRDAILLAIQDALKERNYDEAQALVFKYRAAAKTDEKFAVLAKLVKQGMENAQKIGKIETVLDATPDTDYDVRMALCQKILKIEPNNEKYLEEMNRCRVAKGLDPVDANGKTPLVPTNVQKGIKKGAAVGCFGVLAFLNAVEILVFGLALGLGSAALVVLVELAIHGITLVPAKASEGNAGSVTLRILGNIALWIIALVVCFVLVFKR